MNRPLSTAEMEAIAVAHPVKLTRREKLCMLADLVQHAPGTIHLYSNLEQWGPYNLARFDLLTHPGFHTPISIAAEHPPFLADGLVPVGVGSVMQYLELTMEQMHGFSCDCGGDISNAEAARRLRALAG